MEDILSTIMMADKMTSMLGDVTGLQQRDHPYKNIPHLFDRIEGFPLNALSFGNTATHKNYREGFQQPHPPPPTSPLILWSGYQLLPDFLLLKSVY